MRKLTLYLFILLLISSSSCRKEQLDDCFTSYGTIGSLKRILPDFTRIEIGDRFHVVLMQDSTQPDFIELQGGKNMFPGIHTEVKNGILKITDRNTCNFVRDFKKEITLVINTNHLNAIHVTSATDIQCKDTLNLQFLHIYHAALSDLDIKVNLDEIYVNSINSGSTKLSGKARILKGSIEEVTDLDASALACDEVLLDSHTSWNCYINAKKLIYVRIYNSGNIIYTQEPTDFKELNERKGSGQLLLKN